MTKTEEELYAYLYSISQIEDGIHFIDKEKMPSLGIIEEKARIKTESSYKVKIRSLIKKGFIIRENNKFILTKEFYIPVETISFLNDNMTEEVIKVYKYLEERYRFVEYQKKSYVFTEEEIQKVIGERRTLAKNILKNLQNNRLIECEKIMDKIRLVRVNYNVGTRKILGQ